ncbi:DUF6538 domain-containing protein [Bradyrhizobium erythrophlei]|uniref:DUF6538 domain-containing protein n=1 Tax=Bradyrhizobium erythrophlei TaxID=1437360 RepID=UPI003CC7FDD9
MAVRIFRRDAVYCWRRRPPRAPANFLNRPHLFLSLRTTSCVVARRLPVELDLILEHARDARRRRQPAPAAVPN